MMRNIAVLTPTQRESSFFYDYDICIHHCGVGMAECAAATAKIIVQEKPDLLILAGIAGTYTEDIEIGETVIVESEVIADMGRYSGGVFTDLFQRTYSASVVMPGYKTARSNTVNTAGAIISQPVQAEIENMEGAAFLSVCEKFAVPAMEVRTISNKVGEKIEGNNMLISINRLALELGNILASLRS